MKYEVVEWIGDHSKKSQGWGVFILEKGKTPITLSYNKMDGVGTVIYPTKETAHKAGLEFISREKENNIWDKFI